MLNIGRLNQRVTIQYPVPVRDSHGGRSVTWTTRATVWACLELAAASREAIQGGQVQALTDYTVTIWYRPDVSVKDRVQVVQRRLTGVAVQTRTLEIQSVQTLTGQPQQLALLCREVQA